MPATPTQIPETPERTPTSILAELHENLFRADARIGAMWPWPCMEPSDDFIAAFEFLEMDLVPDAIRPVVEAMGDTALDRLHDGERDAFEELAVRSLDRGLYGWLAKAQHPVYRANGDGGASGSWGHIRSTLIFQSDANLILAKATVLAEKHFEQVLEAHKNRMGAA